MRLVLVSFAFLGWAFYELSGGAEFEPRGVRPPRPEPVIAEPAPVKPAPPISQAAATLVAKPAIAPRKPPATGWTAQTASAEDLDEIKKQVEESLAAADASLAQGLSLFPVAQGETSVSFATEDGGVASLGEVAARPAAQRVEVTVLPAPQPAAEPEPEPDIREVAGTRVNMRDGPGTVYPIITRLNIGQEVEVLSESGTGWLRLRTLQGQQIGWVAASLISDD